MLCSEVALALEPESGFRWLEQQEIRRQARICSSQVEIMSPISRGPDLRVLRSVILPSCPQLQDGAAEIGQFMSR